MSAKGEKEPKGIVPGIPEIDDTRSFLIVQNAVQFLLEIVSDRITDNELNAKVPDFAIEFSLWLANDLIDTDQICYDLKHDDEEVYTQENEPPPAPCDFHSQKRVEIRSDYDYAIIPNGKLAETIKDSDKLGWELLSPPQSPQSKLSIVSQRSALSSGKSNRKKKAALARAKTKKFEIEFNPVEVKLKVNKIQELDDEINNVVKRTRKRFEERNKRIKEHTITKNKNNSSNASENMKNKQKANAKFLTYDNGKLLTS